MNAGDHLLAHVEDKIKERRIMVLKVKDWDFWQLSLFLFPPFLSSLLSSASASLLLLLLLPILLLFFLLASVLSYFTSTVAMKRRAIQWGGCSYALQGHF